MSRRFSWKKVGAEAQLLLIGIPVLLWTLIPIYHMFLFAISERDTATSGRLWPKNPTLQNFNIVFERKHFYLDHFWQQMANSLIIAVAVGVITSPTIRACRLGRTGWKRWDGTSPHWEASRS